MYLHINICSHVSNSCIDAHKPIREYTRFFKTLLPYVCTTLVLKVIHTHDSIRGRLLPRTSRQISRRRRSRKRQEPFLEFSGYQLLCIFIHILKRHLYCVYVLGILFRTCTRTTLHRAYPVLHAVSYHIISMLQCGWLIQANVHSHNTRKYDTHTYAHTRTQYLVRRTTELTHIMHCEEFTCMQNTLKYSRTHT